jgi:ArsR family transcriptional regulator
MPSVAEQTAHTDRIFRALASGTRREIITILATVPDTGGDGCCSEVCACKFSERLGIGAPTVSHHMKTLLDAELVVAEKRGLWVYYRLAPQALADIAEAAARLSGGERPGAAAECSCG